MATQARNALLEDSVKNVKKQVRNGFVAGIVGLLLTCLGFFSYASNLRSGAAWLTVGVGGVAIVIAAFYVMIRADKQADKLKEQVANVTSPVKQSQETPHAQEDGDLYFDEDYEKWKNPFEEDKE